MPTPIDAWAGSLIWSIIDKATDPLFGPSHLYGKKHLAKEAIFQAWRMQGYKASTATTVLVEKGPTVERILTMAKKLGADLIILGISGPRKIADRLGQTVAYRVVCAAPCPVLRIREPVPGPYFEKLFAMEAARPRTGSGSRTNKKESEESKTIAGRKGNRG